MRDTLDNELRAILDRTIADIKRRSTQAGQVATGKTLRALEVKVRQEGAAIIGEIWGRPYTGALETGSRPARRKGPEVSKKSMVVDLAQWCRIRGLDKNKDGSPMTDKQLKNLAAHLAWYIKRYGTRLYRQGGRRDIITPALEWTERTLDERLTVYFEQLVTDEISNNFFNTSQ